MPVRSTSRIAFIASRSETRGRWQPNGCDGGSGRSGSICAHTRSGIRQPSSATTRPITPSLVDFSNEVGLRYTAPGPCLSEWRLRQRSPRALAIAEVAVLVWHGRFRCGEDVAVAVVSDRVADEVE